MPFQHILDRLIQTTPHATGAIFVDWEGETVVKALRANGKTAAEEDYQLKVVGAHQALLVNRIEALMDDLRSRHEILHTVTLRLEGQSVIAERVSPQYVVIMTLDHRGSTSLARRQLTQAGEELRKEL